MKLNQLTNSILLAQTKTLVTRERFLLAEIIDHLQEIYQRKLYAPLGYSNIIKYMIHELKYSESTAFRRYSALKLMIQIPQAKVKLIDGSLSMANATQVQTLLKDKTVQEKTLAINLIGGLTIKDAQKTLFSNFPSIEKKEPTKLIRQSATSQRLSITLKDSAISNLEKLKALTKNYNESELVELALEKMIGSITKEKRLTKISKSKNPRFIPIAMKQQAKIRAHFKCEHPKCGEMHFLELHHLNPIKNGGKNSLNNLKLLCHTHHKYLHRE